MSGESSFAGVSVPDVLWGLSVAKVSIYGERMSNLELIDPEITMRELLLLYPGAQRAMFRHYHIGGCASCGFQQSETLAEVCARNGGLVVGEVIKQIVESHASDLKVMIEPGELSRVLASDPEVRLIDIRTREEFDAVRIEGAIFFTQDLTQEILGQWSRQALLAVVDHLGVRSIDAAAYFAGHGFENVRSVRGGMDAWSQEVDGTLPRYEVD